MHRTVRIAVIALMMCVSLAAVGASGFMLGRMSASDSLVPRIARPGASPAAPTAPGSPTAQDKPHSAGVVELVLEVARIVEAEYYNPGALETQKLAHGAIRGMLETLGDPNTIFSDPTSTRLSEQNMQGSFGGIGITLATSGNTLSVGEVTPDGPAAAAGILAGDVIVAVDGRKTEGMSTSAAVSLIRGQEGTTVVLTMAREGWSAPKDLTLTRAIIRPVNLTTRMPDQSVGYIKLNSFTANSAKEVEGGLRTLRDQGARAIVLDLRGNSGGLLQSAVDISSQFVGSGVVMHEQYRSVDATPVQAKPGGLATDLPVVVLMNRGSASASEIVAGAIQDRQRGVLVGERSYGKDTVQSIHRLSDGSSVRVSIARWYTPNRQEIAQKGLQPDIPVAITDDDLRAQKDPQLEAALTAARARLAGR